jgi:PAS domain S-box-containing protein
MPARSLTNNVSQEQDQSHLLIPLHKVFWISTSILLIISILDLAGWIMGISWFKSIVSYWVPMKITSALCFILNAAALAIIFTKRPVNLKTTGPVIISSILILVSSLTIISWFFFYRTGHEASLTGYPVFELFLSPRSRIPEVSAGIFLITGIVLILLTPDMPAASNIAHTLYIPAALAGYLIPLSYLLGVNTEQQFPGTPVALNSGLAFCAVAFAVYTIRSDTWAMRVFISKEAGGVMARRLLPWLLLLPAVMGWIHIYGERSGLFTSEVGELIEEIVYTFCFILFVWIAAKSVNLADRKRHLANEALKRSYRVMEDRIRERTSDLVKLNKALDVEITERIRAEELVEAERMRINDLLELMPAYIILLTPDYHVPYSNRFFRERFGIANGRRCFEFLFNRTEPCEICDTYKVLKDNKPHTWEWTGPDGNIYSIFDFPYQDSSGSTLIMEMGIDVTSLKKAESKLVTLNAELEQRVKERTTELTVANKRLDILSRISGRLLASQNPQEIINSLCTHVMKFLDCQVFFNFLADETGVKLHLNSYAGVPEKTAQKFEWPDFEETVCGCVAREGVRILAEDIQSTSDPGTDLVKSFGIKAYACHPLLSHDKVIGTLSFGTTTRTTFSEDDLSLMKSVTDQVAIAMKRVRDEDFLRRSEERYRKLLESSPNACLVSRDDKIVLLNPAAQKLLGVESIEKILGTSYLQFFLPENHQKIRTRMKKIMKGESVPVMEDKIIRSDGEIRDVEIISVELVDSEGPAYQVIMTDITERKIAEKELYDTRNYLQNLLDYANAPIIVWDKENKIRLFNHAFEHLTGYTFFEVEGRNLDLLFPKNSMKKSMAMIRHALTENWVTIEIPILTKNQDIRTVLWNSAKIYDKNKKTFSIIAQGNDITERIEVERAFKESKVKLDIALENGNIGTWEWEIGTGKFDWDERMERMFGHENGTFGNTYEAFEKCIHEEDLLHVRNAFRQALNENILLDTIFRIRHNNDINYISTKALVEKDERGNPKKMSGVCFDITEMKLGAEKVLFQLNEELLRSNKELEQFAYVASHDLQEPLRMVSSFTQLLSQRYKDKLDNNAQDFIQFAVEGASRMQVLINDLLDYSRIGTKGNEFSKVDIHDVLGRVVSNLQLKIQEKNALITNDEVPTVVADEGQMIQLFQNLILNSLKFSRSSPRVHISAKEEKDHYLFSVKDNGIGIEAQYFDRIFQIFQRLHPKDKYGGTGIGLPICKRIVDRHGGEIWVESKPGKGSVFYFTILKNKKS